MLSLSQDARCHLHKNPSDCIKLCHNTCKICVALPVGLGSLFEYSSSTLITVCVALPLDGLEARSKAFLLDGFEA